MSVGQEKRKTEDKRKEARAKKEGFTDLVSAY